MSSCPICGKQLGSKYTLKSHIDRLHTVLVDKHRCDSKECTFETVYYSEYKRHIQSCLYVEMEKRLANMEEKYLGMLARQEELFCRMLTELEELEESEESEESQESQESQESGTSISDLEEIARQNFEEFFWNGQRGAAEFVHSHILSRSKLLVCTDFARKKFKIRKNVEDDFEPDIRASKFIKLVAPPIKKVAGELHTILTRDLEADRKADRVDKLWADGKIKQADEAFLDICVLDHDLKNRKFISKLAELTKS